MLNVLLIRTLALLCSTRTLSFDAQLETCDAATSSAGPCPKEESAGTTDDHSSLCMMRVCFVASRSEEEVAVAARAPCPVVATGAQGVERAGLRGEPG